MQFRGGPLLPLLTHLSQPSRRQMLRWSALGAAALSCRSRGKSAPPPTPAPADSHAAAALPAQGKLLAAPEWRALEAATARILPSDDGAGARGAGVIRFIDAELATPALVKLAPVVIQGARLLDQWARERFGRPLADCAAGEQDEVLDALAHGRIPVKAFPQRELFQLLHTLTIEGFVSDPVHGGNAGMIGWRAIGFAEPHLRTPGEPAHHHLPVKP